MDEGESKLCPNCKREIPCVNYTTHTVHCLRNIRVCPVCKEPVPQAELQEHHDLLHKLLPCKQCGESVCGTDLEDHIRDSCANTIKSCRFCDLELPRREIPAHEGYCGVRTEQCEDCREWVMIKYRQLHVDSNHGFIRLDDDPAPVPKKEPPKSNLSNVNCSTSNGLVGPTYYDNMAKSSNVTRPTTEIRYYGNQDSSNVSSGSSDTGQVSWRGQSQTSGVKPPVKRTNDQPQININVAATDKVNKDLPISRGAIKKRPAPRPPTRAPLDPSSVRDMPYYSAIERQQREEKERQEQNAYNLSVGLPPVLNPAAKVEKLRKMDALHNRETTDNDYKNQLQGRVWAPPSLHSIGHVLGTHSSANTSQNSNNITLPTNVPGTSQDADLPGRSQANSNLPGRSQANSNLPGRSQANSNLPGRSQANSNLPGRSQANSNLPGRSQANSNLPGRSQANSNLPGRSQANSNLPGRSQNANILRTSQNANKLLSISHNVQNTDDNETKEQFKDLKPMSPQEFMERFNKLQLRRDVPISSPQQEMGERRSETGDRFSEIKTSLRELRRGLNEVTAPYNSNANVANNTERGGGREGRGVAVPTEDEEVVVPCEFCAAPVPLHDLVQHQTGCRPDLAQYRPHSPLGACAPPSPRHVLPTPNVAPLPAPPDLGQLEEPVIPCEFCAASLPVYLISEHQERCSRESNLLYVD